jgi:predicted Zn-dependent protease
MALGAFTFVLFLLFSVPALGQKYQDIENIGKRNINKGSMNFFSIEKEIAWGQQLSQQVELISPLLRDDVTQEYVDSVVQRLVRNSDAYAPFTVKIIDSREINAFALPGGFLYVNMGLILEAQTESELAGILAHEIAHVTARHATKQMSKGKLFQWLTLPLVFVGGGAGAAIQQGIGLAGPLTFLKFKRNSERDADLLGLQYAYRAGYDPAALVNILERLGNEGTKNRLAKIFSTHPMNDDRIQRAQRGIAKILPDRSSYVVSTSKFDFIRDRLARYDRNKNIYDPGDEDDPRFRRKTQ